MGSATSNLRTKVVVDGMLQEEVTSTKNNESVYNNDGTVEILNSGHDYLTDVWENKASQKSLLSSHNIRMVR